MVRRAGGVLFIDTDGVLKVLWSHNVPEHLTQLCESNYYGLSWLIEARASE